MSKTVPHILIIDDELGGDDTAKRHRFCEAMSLVEYAPNLNFTEIPDDILAVATFASAQQIDGDWTSNEIDLALEAIARGWPFADGGRWALVCIDMNFSCGQDRKRNELFGRTIFQALRGPTPGTAIHDADRLPVIMFSSDTPEQVENQLGAVANVQVIAKWDGGTKTDRIASKRDFARVLFKEALIEDGSLRYVRDDDTVARVPRENPIIGSSMELLETLRRSRKILSRSKNARILVTGERGAGKELLVGYLHAHRPVARQLGSSAANLVVVHLKETPPELFTAALKGHEKGAFTGANVSVEGPIKRSGWGTVHLDEIGNLRNEDLQILLRLVESESYSSVGGSTEIPINCQFVATTNKDLTAMLARDEFPPDLYDRFEKLTMPPLRARLEDIKILFQTFLDREVKKVGCREKRVDESVWGRMRQEPWNGNVRQLKSVAESIVSDREYSSCVRIADFENAWSQTGDVVRSGWRGGFDELIELIDSYEVAASTPLDGAVAKMERAELRLWKALTEEAIRRDRASRASAIPQKVTIVNQLRGVSDDAGEADRWLQKKLSQWSDVFDAHPSQGDYPTAILQILSRTERQKVASKALKREAFSDE